MFNRNHNYLAEMLLSINEKGKWKSDLSKLTPEQITQQDYEIFNTARLINAWTYANVVLGDYLAGILGTVRCDCLPARSFRVRGLITKFCCRDGSSWALNLAGEHREADHTLLERGAGNSCSVEFNVLYRLHPSMSAEDAAYTGMFTLNLLVLACCSSCFFNILYVIKCLLLVLAGVQSNSSSHLSFSAQMQTLMR